MHVMTHPGNDAYMPDTANNMGHNVPESTQATTFEFTETSNNAMEFNLVSVPHEPQVQEHGDL